MRSDFGSPPRLTVVGYELAVHPCNGLWSRYEGRVIKLVQSSGAELPYRMPYLPEHGVMRFGVWLYERLTDHAGRHALAFMLWRWRASEADRTRLKQRVRKLEAEWTRPYREALGRLLDATDCYEELAAPHEELFSGRDLRNFEELVTARQAAQSALDDCR